VKHIELLSSLNPGLKIWKSKTNGWTGYVRTRLTFLSGSPGYLGEICLDEIIDLHTVKTTIY